MEKIYNEAIELDMMSCIEFDGVESILLFFLFFGFKCLYLQLSFHRFQTSALLLLGVIDTLCFAPWLLQHSLER